MHWTQDRSWAYRPRKRQSTHIRQAAMKPRPRRGADGLCSRARLMHTGPERQEDTMMERALRSGTLQRPGGRGWVTSSVLLVGLLTAASVARADTIPEWNQITANTLQAGKAGTALAQSRVYAMVHGAMFDAVNAIDRRYHSYAADLKAHPGACPDAAAAVAAHAVLMELFSRQQATLDAA